MLGLYVLIGIFVLFGVVHLFVYRGHSSPRPGEYYTGGGLDTTTPSDSTGGVGDGSPGGG